MAGPLPAEAARVLDFWFGELGFDQWFNVDPELDRMIVDRFGDLHAHVVEDGVPVGWLASVEGRLAAVIVFDQFSRNMFRGDPRAFASDARALALARETIERGLDSLLAPERRMFLYMPCMHAEDHAVQAWSVELFGSLDNPKAREAAVHHRDVVARFGRFPARNGALGRTTTQAEEAYLAKLDGMA